MTLLQIGAILLFTFAAFQFAGPLKAGTLPKTIFPYLLLFGAFVLLGSARIVRRLGRK